MRICNGESDGHISYGIFSYRELYILSQILHSISKFPESSVYISLDLRREEKWCDFKVQRQSEEGIFPQASICFTQLWEKKL